MYALQHNTPATPFYYYDIALLRRTLDSCKTAADKYGYHVHFALKANVEPRILQEIQAKGFGADCVSGWEVQAAIENGFEPSKVVFAGVGKSDEEIIYSLEHDIAVFNCESIQEMEVINELASQRGKIASIAFRINPDIEPDTFKHVQTGQGESKFGISIKEVDAAIEILKKLTNLKLIGIHFHIGSQILDLKSFRELADKTNTLNELFLSKGIKLETLNMGGGIGVDYYEPEANPIVDFESYFAVFNEGLKLREGQQVHFELGRSLVAQCGELITKVLFTKQTVNGSNYAIVDAGFNDLMRPALYGAYHKMVNISAEGRTMDKYYIGGPICESTDVFAKDIDFPETKRGDLISFRTAGAYGSIMASNYNLRPTIKSYFSE